MYSENRFRDVIIFGKACVSNLVARFAPATYVQLTKQTGRGSDDDDVEQIAEYFERCFAEYGERLGLDAAAFRHFVRDRRVLEYGPGDVLGVALLFYGHGASHVLCVDRFPLLHMTEKNARVYQRLLARMDEPVRERARRAFVDPDHPQAGLRAECIEYQLTPNGLAGRAERFDLIVSRAVLEHVNSLPETVADVACCLVPGGISLHCVDLRSHNLDRYRPYDFLTWPGWAYKLMYSHKGVPNRWRVGTYRAILQGSTLRVRAFEPTGQLQPEDVQRISPHLAQELRGTRIDELAWQGFWMVLERPG